MLKRQPNHPGIILDELYIKPLNLNLQELAETLGISRNTLFKIRTGKAGITAAIAIRLGEAFNTTPQFWLNLQQKYDIWTAEQLEISRPPLKPLFTQSRVLQRKRVSRDLKTKKSLKVI